MRVKDELIITRKKIQKIMNFLVDAETDARAEFQLLRELGESAEIERRERAIVSDIKEIILDILLKSDN